MKERNRYIDFLRGMTILLVVFGHAIQEVNHGISSNPVHLVIQSFQMSLLFIISGYVNGYSEIDGNYKVVLRRRIKRLLVPYLVWEQLHYFLRLVRFGNTYSVSKHLGSIIWSNFWFLRSLFILSLVYIICIYISSRTILGRIHRKLLIVGAIVISLLFSFVKGMENLRLYSIYFIFGIILFQLKKEKLLTRSSERVIAVISIIGFVVCIVFYYRGIVAWAVFKMMGVLGSVSFSYASYILYQCCKDNILRFIAWIGKNSLAVYAIHWCLLFSLDIPPLWNIPLPIYISAIIGWLLWSFICIILIKLLKKNEITSHILLGE